MCFPSTRQRSLLRDGDDLDQVHAKILEVVCCQIGQQFRVDRIRTECRPHCSRPSARSQSATSISVRAAGRWQNIAPSTPRCPDLPNFSRPWGPMSYEALHRRSAAARLSSPQRLPSLVSPHGRIAMLRSILSAITLAGVIATVPPTFADPAAAMMSDHVQTAAAAEPTSSAPAWSSSSDVPAPTASSGLRQTTAPAGFGWG
jgi:hypothetical protein